MVAPLDFLPTTPSSIDAVPSKLIQLMVFSGDGRASANNAERKKGDAGGGSANGKKIKFRVTKVKMTKAV
ncbi:hypothetical protein K7X08_026424 [Anisodus acutangulus]|uniref:Uncharacterized protein n=1 Tax=Anisodus acutangulus TaxID=402998 RepID=A0A9Q1LPF2_9SOLA|nr:hypothetical protein K7X08_026424 [Anisodus acutangulus]